MWDLFFVSMTATRLLSTPLGYIYSSPYKHLSSESAATCSEGSTRGEKPLRNISGEENQLYDSQWFIELVICSTCFGHLYAHQQELETIVLVTTCGV
jgi:hypothetical protein